MAETLNISEASRRLRVAQPSLSRQIRDLEFEIGHALFDRHKGRLSLTIAGRTLRRSTAKIMAQVESAIAQARQAGSAPPAKLRVGYYGMMWATIIAAALPDFRRQFPKTVVTFSELSPVQIMRELGTGALDLTVLGHSSAAFSRDYTVQKIAPVAALIALSSGHALAKRRVLSLDELRDETFLTYSEDYAPGRDASFLRACRQAKIKPRLLCEAHGLPALLLSVAENRGVALVSPFATRAPHPGVVFARLKPPGVSFDINLVYRRDLPPAGRQFAQLVAGISRRNLLEGSNKSSHGGRL